MARRAPSQLLPGHPQKLLASLHYLQAAHGGSEPVPLEVVSVWGLLNGEDTPALPTSWCHPLGCTDPDSDRFYLITPEAGFSCNRSQLGQPRGVKPPLFCMADLRTSHIVASPSQPLL